MSRDPSNTYRIRKPYIESIAEHSYQPKTPLDPSKFLSLPATAYGVARV